MKKSLLSTALFCLSIICTAQHKETAHSVVEKAVKKKCFQIDFISNTFEKQSLTPLNSGFRASVTVCDKMYCLKSKNVHVMCDGQTIWTHLLLENEVQVDAANSEANIWHVLSNCTKYYSVKKMTTIIDGKKEYYIVEMKACDAENDFLHMTLKISTDALLLKEVKLYEKNGDLHIFTILLFQNIKKLSKEFFKFSHKDHPNIEIVDLT